MHYVICIIEILTDPPGELLAAVFNGIAINNAIILPINNTVLIAMMMSHGSMFNSHVSELDQT